MNVNPHSQVLKEVVGEFLGTDDVFQLVDVGASGGIAYYWDGFEPKLAAVGFDPLVHNVDELSKRERRKSVRYVAAYVGCNDFESLFPRAERSIRLDPYIRTSAVRAHELMQLNFVAETFNDGAPIVWSDRHLTLDEYFERSSQIDFLKVDTDGSDLQVLLGAERLLRDGAALGVLVEAQFQGWAHDYANTFANIDRFLRKVGFSLFDLDRNRYTRGALPGVFEYDMAAQTTAGQALWGDALYFRDLAHPNYEDIYGYTVSRERLLKLVALFDLFGLPDCAAELLLQYPHLTDRSVRTHLLDLLTLSAGFSETYEEHMSRFGSDPKVLFRARYDQQRSVSNPVEVPEPSLPTVTPEVARLRESLQRCKEKLRHARQKLETRAGRTQSHK